MYPIMFLVKASVTLLAVINCSGVHAYCENNASVKLSSYKYKYKSQVIDDASDIISMTVDHRISKATCDYTDSYGFRGNKVWVDNGCRAVFKICYTKDAGAYCQHKTSLRLSSNGYQYASQILDDAAIVTSMRVRHQISKATCDYGDSYGFRGSTMWVNNGCRAIFSVCFRKGTSVTVECSSRDYKPKVCKIPTNGGRVLSVVPEKHKSRSPCLPGDSYFHTDKVIRVTNGCRAVFRVGIKN
ncbi:lectin ADEL [Patella vulgata]|uniref:lectin ADEL n=1 Tax=Patella vulgata TaxID=6465 RepID=UPI00217F239E|nr:lectin ADEL [Patella vulgata]